MDTHCISFFLCEFCVCICVHAYAVCHRHGKVWGREGERVSTIFLLKKWQRRHCTLFCYASVCAETCWVSFSKIFVRVQYIRYGCKYVVSRLEKGREGKWGWEWRKKFSSYACLLYLPGSAKFFKKGEWKQCAFSLSLLAAASWKKLGLSLSVCENECECVQSERRAESTPKTNGVAFFYLLLLYGRRIYKRERVEREEREKETFSVYLCVNKRPFLLGESTEFFSSFPLCLDGWMDGCWCFFFFFFGCCCC